MNTKHTPAPHDAQLGELVAKWRRWADRAESSALKAEADGRTITAQSKHAAAKTLRARAAEAEAARCDLHQHLLDMLGAKDHQEAGAVIARLHASTVLATPAPHDAQLGGLITPKARLLALADGWNASLGEGDSLDSSYEIGERDGIRACADELRSLAKSLSDGDAEDAARYRWMKEHAVDAYMWSDESIDAARQSPGEGT